MVLKEFGSGLKKTFRKIAGMGVVDEAAVKDIVRDLQRTLIQSDVDVEMVSEISESIQKKVLEEEKPAGMTLKEHLIKTLYDELVRFLGKEKGELELKPQKILLIGLFGSGKTSSAGKLARWFSKRGLSSALVACDAHRAAAQEQLEQVGEEVGVPVYSEGGNPEDIAKKTFKKTKEDVLIFDSAGRDSLDEELAEELKELAEVIHPDEVLLVIPADIGQAAGKQARRFNQLVGITGLVVTKVDGTAKGGGALAAAAEARSRVKFIGTGEKMKDLETYDPERFISRLVGYGDIQGLLEKAKEAGIEEETAKEMLKGDFTLDVFYKQLKNIDKMGALSKITEMLPGFGQMKLPSDFLEVQEEKMEKWRDIINSLTPEEREKPDIIKSSRVKRAAQGSGNSEKEVREMLKRYKQTKKMMKMVKGGRGLKRGPLAKLAKQFGMGGR